jgi:hypothetical protein
MISDYLKNLMKVLGFGAAFAALPLIAAFADLQPPWPPAIGYVSAGLVMLAALIVWEWTRRTRTRSRRTWIIAATVLMLVGLIAYLTLYSLFVEPIPGAHARVVRGYVCTADAARVYGDACPDLPREALAGAEWEAVKLWTRGSVTMARLGLAGAWAVFMTGWIAALGAVIAGRKV